MTAIGRRYNGRLPLPADDAAGIKDPKVSVPFYERHFGMKLVPAMTFLRCHSPLSSLLPLTAHSLHAPSPQWKFSLYFLERPRDAAAAALPLPGTKASAPAPG